MKEIEFQKIEGDYPYRLLLQADETREGIEEYLFDSQVWVARLAGRDEPVGVMCLLRVDGATVELMNIAVDEPFRGRGIGGAMIEKAVGIAAELGYREIILGTGTEDCAPDLIRFYERHGFRKSHLRKDYFVEKYPDEPIIENGVQLRDMQVLARPILPH
jgi:ribosomal protein S18 acetylase RimI-like enzyme